MLKIEANEATIGFSSKLLSMQTTQAELRIDLIWKNNSYNIRDTQIEDRSYRKKGLVCPKKLKKLGQKLVKSQFEL